MHGEIDAPVEQRLLDLLGEQALAADVRQRPILDAVAGGLDDDQRDRLLVAAESRARTARACTSARGLPRVPMRRRAVDCAMVPLDGRPPFSSPSPQIE